MFNLFQIKQSKALRKWCDAYKESVQLNNTPYWLSWVMNQYTLLVDETSSLLHFIEEFGGCIDIIAAEIITSYDDVRKPICKIRLKFRILKSSKDKFPSPYTVEDLALGVIAGKIKYDVIDYKSDYLSNECRFIINDFNKVVWLSLNPSLLFQSGYLIHGIIDNNGFLFEDPKFYRIVLLYASRFEHARLRHKFIQEEKRNQRDILLCLQGYIRPTLFKD